MNSQTAFWFSLLVLVICIRVLTLSAYPLADTTEARYAEVARLMATTNDWITPQIELGVPFWAKPPLSFWATALSFKVFDQSELTARLPALIWLLLTAGVLFWLNPYHRNRSGSLAAIVVLFTTAVGFISAGAVMTDGALVFAVTLAMAAFWRFTKTQKKRWGYIFFIALALGLLAKGPVAWVLTLTPLIVWLSWCGYWQRFFLAVTTLDRDYLDATDSGAVVCPC